MLRHVTVNFLGTVKLSFSVKNAIATGLEKFNVIASFNLQKTGYNLLFFASKTEY